MLFPIRHDGLESSYSAFPMDRRLESQQASFSNETLKAGVNKKWNNNDADISLHLQCLGGKMKENGCVDEPQA